MELEMFSFIESVIEEYDMHQATYAYAENTIRSYFESICAVPGTSVVSVHTRIKTRESLREKLLRNKFYLHFDHPRDALMYLSDLVGVTIECQFIRNEAYNQRSVPAPGTATESFCKKEYKAIRDYLYQQEVLRKDYGILK